MSSIIGTYCDFCQISHSSNSCYHPGRKLLEAAEAERDEWKRRALAAEAHLNAQGQVPGHIIRYQDDTGEIYVEESQPDEQIAGTA